MSSSFRLEEPYLLLSIPNPVGGKGSSAQASAVSQYYNQRVRQRSEVSVAVDGEGLYIYDVENSRLITSYALSPSTRFVCEPTSFVIKRATGRSRRVTVAAIRVESSDEISLVSFSEALSKSSLSAKAKDSVSQTKHSLAEFADVQSILVQAPSKHGDANEADFSVCVVSTQGDVDCFSGDLTKQHWKSSWSTGDESGRVEYAGLSSVGEAEADLLRGRADIVADLRAVSGTGHILVAVRAQKSGEVVTRTVHAMALPGITGRQLSGTRSIVLTAHRVTDLPNPGGRSKKWDAPLRVKREADALFALSGHTLIRWAPEHGGSDLKMATLRGVSSYEPLSASQVAYWNEQARTMTVYDFAWGSVHGRSTMPSDSKTGSKRSLHDSTTAAAGQLDLFTFLQRSATAIGIASKQLIACKLAPASEAIKRRRVGDSTLADAIGLGQEDPESPELVSFRATIRDIVRNKSTDDLDEHLAKELDIPYTRGAAQDGEVQTIGHNANTEGRASEETVRWSFPQDTSSVLRNASLPKAKAIFEEITDVVGSRLRFRCFPEGTMQWLALVGRLGSGSRGQLMEALARYDSTLSTMGIVLNFNFFLDISEVVKALDIVVDSLDSPVSQDQALRIEDSTPEDDDASINDASAAAENDLAYALASLNYGTAVRGGLLRSISDRLNAFPTKQIVTTFHSTLTPRKIIFLINLLRIELADGGWTTRYTDETYETEDDAEEGPADNSISTIVKLLNASVDAIGATGWNVGLSSDKLLNTDEMVLVLRAEISAALDGCEDYRSLGAALVDFDKYAMQIAPSSKAAKRAVARRRESGTVQRPGFLVDDVEESLMPMGSRVERIEMTRTSKGGRVDAKSKGAIGQEISMRVGRYSIDRIRV